MIAALVQGCVFRAPEQRMSNAGKPYVAAAIRVKDAGGSQFVRIVAFSETVEAELLRLADGDAVSVQGPLTVSPYQASDGSTKLSLSLVADRVLALRRPRERKPDSRPRQELLAAASGDPDDEIPF